MITSLLSSPTRRSLDAPRDNPELGVSRGDLLHYDPADSEGVYHGRRIPRAELLAALTRPSAPPAPERRRRPDAPFLKLV